MSLTARCGCNATCACCLTAGSGITISGTGNTGTCYTISSTTGALTVVDTPSIDETLTGTGLPGDPYVLSSSVIVDPVAGNVLTSGAGGLAVACEAVQDCIGTAIGAGAGATYNDAGNSISVLPSVQAGNQIVAGTDGRLYVPPAVVGITPVTVTDTTCVDLTLSGAGTTPSPWNISAAPILAPSTSCAPNKLTCTASGLLARQTAPTLRRTMAVAGRAAVSAGGRTSVNTNHADFTTPVFDTGTAVGVWTVNGDGTITLNCAGIYLIQLQGGAIKNTGTCRGQLCRILVAAVIQASFDMRDALNVTDWSTVSDGPEASVFCLVKATAAQLVTWAYNADMGAVGNTADMSGAIQLAYIGENP